MSILEDWREFIKGSKAFDKSHFTTLISELAQSEVGEVFSTFRSGELSAERALAAIRRDAHTSIGREARRDLAHGVIDEDKKNVHSAGEKFPAKNFEVQIAPRADVRDLQSGDLNLEIVYLLGDIFSDDFDFGDEKLIALLEVCYGIANSYDVARHIISPIVDSKFETDARFRLWLSNSILVYATDGVVISK